MSHITTYTGKLFDPLIATADEVEKMYNSYID